MVEEDQSMTTTMGERPEIGGENGSATSKIETVIVIGNQCSESSEIEMDNVSFSCLNPKIPLRNRTNRQPTSVAADKVYN